jgi:GTPase SAR1 family protein
MPITLPKEITPPSRVWPTKLLLYGQPKVGKTTILSKLPGCLIVELDEGGADYIPGMKVQINNVAEFDELCTELIKNNKPYEFVALDTATKLEEWCEAVATEDYLKSGMASKEFKASGASVLTLKSGDFSPGYQWLRAAFQRKIGRLMRGCNNLIIIAHLRDKFLKALDTTEKGKADSNVYSRDIDLTGKIKTMMTTGADAIGFLYRSTNPATNEQKLKVSFKTLEAVNCGTRSPHLVGVEKEFDWELIYPGLAERFPSSK